MIILGIDPGLAIVGYGAVSYTHLPDEIILLKKILNTTYDAIFEI